MNFAAIYARSSLGKERQGETVEHQIEMIKEFANRSNMDIIFDDRFIYEDDGESGFKTTLLQRPAMSKLLSDIERTGLIKTVFFKGISRFARDSGESITTAKKLSNMGIRVISLEENYDSFRDEPTMFQIYAVMAEQESRKTSIRVSLGNKSRARGGIWPGTTTPLGYTKIKFLNDELKKTLIEQGKHPQSLYPNEYAHIVQKIFHLYVKENMGRKRIVAWLNDNGYKTNRGKLFQEKHIVDILQNEAYIGNIVYGKTRYNYVEDDEKNKKIQQVVYLDEKDWVRTENAHPAIIDKETFDLAQKKIQEHKQLFPHPKKFNAAKHPLTGLLKCGKCGANMICQKRTNKKKDGTKLEYRYYVCSTYHKKGRHVCPQANVNADHLEDEILAFIQEKLDQYIDYNNTGGVREKENKKNGILSDINQIDNLLKKKMDASKTLLEQRQYYDIETFVELNKDLQGDIKKLREQKDKLETAFTELNDQDTHIEILELAKELKEKKNFDLEYKRKVFHKLLESVVFQDDEVKEINFYSSFKL